MMNLLDLQHNEERQGSKILLPWVRSCYLAKWLIHLEGSKI